METIRVYDKFPYSFTRVVPLMMNCFGGKVALRKPKGPYFCVGICLDIFKSLEWWRAVSTTQI